MEYTALIAKVSKYKSVRENTIKYREAWHNGLREMIVTTLEDILKDTGLQAEIETKDDVENLEVIMLNLGRHKSGIREKLDKNEFRSLVQNDGMLIYQQLFNGKIMVMIVYPYLEGYGEPQPPKNLEILRPHELTKDFIVRHMEELLKEITAWEDYDDDESKPPPIGFTHNFQMTSEPTDD